MNGKLTLMCRHLLLPITAIICYFIVFGVLYVSFAGAAWFFTLSWFWIIVGISLLGGLVVGIFSIIAEVPMLIYLLFNKLYKSTWFSIIIHSLTALYATFAVVHSYFFQTQNIGDISGSVVSILWQFSAFRTILFFIFILPNILLMCYFFIVLPITLRYEKILE